MRKTAEEKEVAYSYLSRWVRAVCIVWASYKEKVIPDIKYNLELKKTKSGSLLSRISINGHLSGNQPSWFSTAVDNLFGEYQADILTAPDTALKTSIIKDEITDDNVQWAIAFLREAGVRIEGGTFRFKVKAMMEVEMVVKVYAHNQQAAEKAYLEFAAAKLSPTGISPHAYGVSGYLQSPEILEIKKVS